MDSNIVISKIQLIDIFLRFVAVGILSLQFTFVLRFKQRKNTLTQAFLTICLMAYILLTAPIENAHYGWLRPPLLLLTDCTTYALLVVYWRNVRGISLFSAVSVWIKYATSLWFVWLGYFFLIEEGIGTFHRIHHGIGLLILLFVLVDAIRGFNDDLVESRRDTRKLAIVLISSYMVVLTLIELFIQPLKDQWLFSLLNALMMLVFALVFAWHNFDHALSSKKITSLEASEDVHTQEAYISPLVVKLSAIMEEGFYTQNALTISKLAKEIEVPEHKLRLLVNKELGFENFSQYLNSYRIPAVSRRLKNPVDKDIPILTLALGVGYNSIAPFNRAFKDLNGVTPSEYRRSYLNNFQK